MSEYGGNGRKCVIEGTNRETFRKWICQGLMKSQWGEKEVGNSQVSELVDLVSSFS